MVQKSLSKNIPKSEAIAAAKQAPNEQANKTVLSKLMKTAKITLKRSL